MLKPLFSFVALACLLAVEPEVLQAQTPNTPMDLRLKSLHALLSTIRGTPDTVQLQQRVLDSLVTLMEWVERPGQIDSTGHDDMAAEKRIDADTFSPVVDRILKEAKTRGIVIRVVLKLQLTIHRNVELRELMPIYVQEALHVNPAGFLRVYRTLDAEQREQVRDALEIPSETNVRKELHDYARTTHDTLLRKEATHLASQVTQEDRP